MAEKSEPCSTRSNHPAATGFPPEQSSCITIREMLEKRLEFEESIEQFHKMTLTQCMALIIPDEKYESTLKILTQLESLFAAND